MNADSRGIRRGGCADPICRCPGYDGGTEKKRCVTCGHPPGKHQNLDNPSATMGACSGIMPNSSQTGYHMAPRQLPPDLPLCTADGCTNKVYYEFDLREDLRAFNYCSPECRDRHLLPIKRHELEEELAEMKQELERVATKDSPKMMQRQQSNGQSSGQLPSRGHSSSPSSSTSSTSTSIKSGNRKIKEVMIEKKARRSSGLILSKKPYIIDKADILGFIIVGVVKDTAVYSKLQDDQIRLLDVIETVNDTPCHRIFLPSMDLQERFEHSIEERGRVKLALNRCIALPPVSRPLSIAKKLKYTHVTVLRYSAECEDDTYGLSLNHECKVKGVIKDSPGDLSRVRFDDKIAMYAVVSQDENEIKDNQLVSDKQLSSLKLDLQAAHRKKNNVILFIKKSEDITFI